MKHLGPSLFVLGLCTVGVACDSSSSTATQAPAVEVREVELESPFPDAAAVAELAARPRPEVAVLLGRAVADVDTWAMSEPGAERVQAVAYAGTDRNAKVLAKVLAEDATGRRLTQDMQCIASEHGRFVLAHGADPAADIQAFIATRCGTAVSDVQVVVTELPAGGPKSLSFERDGARLAEAFGGTPSGTALGLFRGRNKERTVEVLAFGTADVELAEPLPLAGHAGSVQLRGTVAWDYDTLRGWATAGALGVAACTPIGGTPGVSPSVSLECPVAAGEAPTMIELYAAPRGQLPERRVLRVLVGSGETVPTTYQAAAVPVPASGGVVSAVRALRQAASVPELTAVEAQNAVLGSLLPVYLEGSADPSTAELATQAELGMIVGREIEGDLAWGGLLVSTSPRARPLERELAALMASPRARALLLDSSAKHLAYATLDDPQLGMRRSVLAVYGVPTAEVDRTAQVTAYLDSLDLQRGAAGLPPVTRGGDPADLERMQATVARVNAGELGPAAALDELLRYIAAKTNRSFKGSIVFPHALEGWSPVFQGSLLEAPEVTVIAAIGRMPMQDAWGRPMVVVLYEAKEAAAAAEAAAEAAVPEETSTPDPAAPASAAEPTPPPAAQ